MQERQTISRPSASEIESTVIDWLRSVGDNAQDIRPESRLDDLDVDSLDLVEIADLAQARWAVTLDVADVKDISRVGEFIDAVTSRLP